MITLGHLSDFTSDERAQLQEACIQLNDAIVDPVFLATLQAAVFDNTTDSNAVVIGKLAHDVTITRLYCENLGWWATHVSKTIAVEEPDGTITFNRPYFDRQTIASKANTLFHEFLHAIGYSHRSKSDYRSWPYQAGNLLEAYLKKIASVTV